MPAVRRNRAMELVWRLHLRLYRATGGRLASSFGGMPILILTTIGRKSGEPRSTPLMHLVDGERRVVVASNAGEPTDPAWLLNLRTNPEATVEVRGRSWPVTAREAEGDERESLWGRVVAINDDYEEYARRAAARRIPVVVLEPASSQ